MENENGFLKFLSENEIYDYKISSGHSTSDKSTIEFDYYGEGMWFEFDPKMSCEDFEKKCNEELVKTLKAKARFFRVMSDDIESLAKTITAKLANGEK